jgi:hypothetical protein
LSRFIPETPVLLLFSALIFFAGNALALNFTDDYWTPTNFTNSGSGSAEFVLVFEWAFYESDFGLFTEDANNDVVLFEIFDKNQERGRFSEPTEHNVDFRLDSGNWQIKLQEANAWTNFSNNFGFYFGVHTEGTNDSSLDYLFFTDTQFNQLADGTSIDTNVEHVATWFNGEDSFWIFLDDQLGGGDRDWNGMIVSGNNLAPSHTAQPEPATMMLLGSGLVGLAIVGKKKLFKKPKTD